MNLAATSPCPLPLPRYYHTLFTHTLSKPLRTLADEAPTCGDVLMNFLVAAVTKLPPIKVPCSKQHQEGAPLVRSHGGWGGTRRPPSVGRETETILSHCLT
jgi:hypothetical protein